MANNETTIMANGFTIVELLVVVVVIGILAAITIVSYTSISNKAVAASLQSDLIGASKQLKMYQVINGSYPIDLDCAATPVAGTICLKASPGNTFRYEPNTNGYQTFILTNTHANTTSYRITDNSSPVIASAVQISCPAGFIPIPGSVTYGTNDFCVMKYEAKQSSATVPVSQADGLPWTAISQTSSASYSHNVAGCVGCHLITDSEFLTIAQNVLNIPSNWSGNAVGSGYIYSGHNDSIPATSIVADNSDSNGYANTNNIDGNQRRTLTLSNGEIIWDLAGNAWEWTSGTATTGQPGIVGEPGYTWKEWTGVTNAGTLSPNSSPAIIGLAGSSAWNSSNGIGELYSYVGETSLRGITRGGCRGMTYTSGVMALNIGYLPSDTYSYIGFRVAR